MKYISLTVFLLLTSFANAQESNSGEIIISRQNLISILEKFKQNPPETFVSNQNVASRFTYTTIDSTQVKIVELQKSLKFLHKKIDSMNVEKMSRMAMEDATSKLRSSTSRVDTIWNANQQTAIYTNEKAASTNSKVNDGQIDRLNNKIDRLMAQQLVMQSAILLNSSQKPKTVTDTLVIQQKIIPVTSLEANENVVKTETLSEEPTLVVAPIVAKPNPVVATEPTVFEKLNETYGNYKASIFFDNNSIVFNDDASMETLYGLTQILSQNPTVDVYLKGFASKSGSKAYNDKISLTRTLKVKQYLISKGVSPNRILSYNPGIDYDALTPAEARRVTISFIIRK